MRLQLRVARRTLGVWVLLLFGLVPERAASAVPPMASPATTSSTAASPAADARSVSKDAPSSVDVKAGLEVSAYTDTDNVSVLTPSLSMGVSDATSGYSANGSYLIDVVTAASVDIVSTATPRWTEIRHAGTLSASYKPDAVGGTVAAAVSREPDYLALTGGLMGQVDLDRKRFTLGFGYSLSRNEAGRHGTPFSVYSLVYYQHALQGSLDIVVNRSTEATLIADAILEIGRQEKPYRYVPLFAPNDVPNVPNGASIDQVNALRLPGRVAERVPQSRKRFALSSRLATRGASTTLVGFERLYADDWGLLATTTDVRYIMDIGRRFDVFPDLRFHLQSGTYFWTRAYEGTLNSGVVVAPEYRSGDRENGPLMTGTLGLGGEWLFGGERPESWVLGIRLEGSRTTYFDALFVSKRYAAFTALTLDKVF